MKRTHTLFISTDLISLFVTKGDTGRNEMEVHQKTKAKSSEPKSLTAQPVTTVPWSSRLRQFKCPLSFIFPHLYLLMNSIEISLAPHKFDECRIWLQDSRGYPTRINYYWKGNLKFHILMSWDAKGWREWFKIVDDQLPVL